jgi:lactate dehydrogenase-like 2-hydroxyacid dehydrogenase
MLCAVSDPMDAAMIAAEGRRRVRILANFAVGVDNIDLAAAKAAGLAVSNTPGVLTDATADLAMALILAATRRMSETEAILRRGKWDGFRPTGFMGMGLQGKTLGIIGMGRIGQATARRAALAFRM